MKMRSTWFLTTLTIPVYFLFLENDQFCDSGTQSHTSAKGQAPMHAAEKRSFSQQWDQNLGAKDATFVASSHARLTEYNAVVT